MTESKIHHRDTEAQRIKSSLAPLCLYASVVQGGRAIVAEKEIA